MKKLITLILLLSFSIKAQSQIIFDNVKQKQIISQKSDEYVDTSGFASIFTFGHLSKAKVDELGNYLYVLLKYKNSKEGYNLYDSDDGNTPFKPKDLIKQLVRMIDVNPKDGKPDMVDVDYFYDPNFKDPLTGKPNPETIGQNFVLGDKYQHKEPSTPDSTWFISDLIGFRFTEDWIIDTVKFTCDIKSISYAPLYYDYFGHPRASFYQIKPKPTIEKQTFNFITDFIITDIYIDYYGDAAYLNPFNGTNLDTYKTLMLINFIIDKAKLGKIACFNPIIPFNTQLTTAELKSLLTEELSFNKDDNFQVRNKLYCYSFKMVEKWAFDSKSLAFKKVALGIVLMKMKKKTLVGPVAPVNPDGPVDPYNFNYEFIPVFYTPFNKK